MRKDNIQGRMTMLVTEHPKNTAKRGGNTMAKTLSTLSDDLASAIESAGPAVVRVEATRRLGACGLATGFVWSPDGVIVTAHHVVERDDNIKVGLADDPASSVPATLVGRDPTSDIAVLRTDARDLTPLSWADQRVPANDISIAGYTEFADNIRVGHMVFALGRPSKTVQANLGIVGAFGFAGRYLVTDVAMDPRVPRRASGRCQRKVVGTEHHGSSAVRIQRRTGEAYVDPCRRCAAIRGAHPQGPDRSWDSASPVARRARKGAGSGERTATGLGGAGQSCR